jgi:hypothetical protein
MNMIKRAYLLFFIFLPVLAQAQNEIGPEGHKLIWIMLFFVLLVAALFIGTNSFIKINKKKAEPIFKRRKTAISLVKSSLYYPDFLTLTIQNTGNVDVDIDRPLLVFDNFWLKRKFKIKGLENRSLYPLFLEKGKTHSLQIDLNRFYYHDKSLKKYPKAMVSVFDVHGKKLARKSVYLRKTLIKF